MTRTVAVLLLMAAAAPAAPPPVTAVTYRPDGAVLAAGTHGRVTVIDTKTGTDTVELTGIPGRVTAVTYSSVGRLAVAAGEPGKSGVVRLYDSASQAPVIEWTAHKDVIYTLAFAPDGKTLATAGYDRVVKVWPVSTTAPTAPALTLTDHSDTVYAAAFHPAGKLLATAAADRAVKVWDTATGKRLYTLGDSTDWVYTLAWSPDGKRLAAAGVDKSLRVWEADAAGGTLKLSAFAHEAPVVRLAFAPDGKTVFTAAEDGGLKAWDAAKLVETRVFPKQPDAVLALAVRPDGQQLAVGRFDGTGLFYDPATGKAGPAFLPAKPKPPAVSKLTPDAGRRGTTLRVTVTGSRLDTATGITADVPGVSAKLISKAPTTADIELSLPPTVAVSPLKLTLTSTAGPSSAVVFHVDRFPLVAESAQTDSARTARSVTLPASVAGQLDRAGDVDYFAFDAAAGQQVGVQLVTSGGKLDPVLVITDADGRPLAEGTGGLLGFVAPAAGRYAVSVRDREFRGGPDFAYRLHAGPVPVVTGVFPLGVQRGREADVHVTGVNLGTPHGQTVRVKVPADAKPGSTIPVPVAATNGETPLGTAVVVAGDFPGVVAGDAGAEIRIIPGTADGILAKPGEGQTVRFHAKKGDRLLIETHARRLGSPADTAIEVLDSAGKPVPRAVLRCVAKTFVTFRDHDSDKPGIRLDAWNELATNDYLFTGGELMKIHALPRNPDDDCQFWQVAGARVGFLDTTPRHHAQNAAIYKVEIHPPGSTFPPNGMPMFPLAYTNDDGGPGYAEDSRLFFDPPADGVYQVRVADGRGLGGPRFAYRLTVRRPRPDYTLSVSPMNPAVWAGGAVPVTVTATRADGFDGPIRVKPVGLPAGYAAPETLIEAGQTTATFAVSAAADAKPAGSPVTLEGHSAIDGKDVVRTADLGKPTTRPAGDLTVTTNVKELAIRPGQETKILVTIERKNGFAGRVPVEVRGLPHGVKVLHVGLNGILITERETKRVVFLSAEPWVPPHAMPIVVVARQEKKGSEHAAGSVVLKVEK